jgi:beta-galactosidase/beta-glucuronidase
MINKAWRSLPSAVEEHYWGKFGTRPYAHNEAQRGPGTSFENGNYLGVSWWWREIEIPKFKAGQRVIVSIRSARLRSEVYCNGKLCGYTIMTELPFQADLTGCREAGTESHNVRSLHAKDKAIRVASPHRFASFGQNLNLGTKSWHQPQSMKRPSGSYKS